MTNRPMVLVLTILVLGIGAATQAASPSELLEKGIYAEETVGNLDEAIKIYKQIVDEAKTNRPAAAQAMFRLGACHLKKGQTNDAISTFNLLIAQYPDQKELVTKAQKQIQATRQNMSEAEMANMVEAAITTISTCAEGDSKIAPALASLQGLNETIVAKALVKYLGSEQDTMRRSAIYILWKSDFESIEPAVPALIKLCAHPEEFTRGMAALALGDKKVESSSQKLSDMALNDKSNYARRCAAIALGWLGRADAKEILERVLKDSDPMVRTNAVAAIKQLGSERPHVLRTTPAAFANDVDPALDKITATFDQEMMNESFSWTGEGEMFPTTTGKPSFDATKTKSSLPVKLEPGKVYWVGINSPSYRNFQNAAHLPANPYVILFATKSSDGKPTPIPENLAKKAKAINTATTTQAVRKPTLTEKREGEKLSAEGWQLWQQQKFAESEKKFEQSVEKDPTNPHAWNGLGWSRFNQGKPLNAQEAFEKSVALQPKHSGALNGLGYIAGNAGRTEEAISYWERAVAASPQATASLSGLTHAYMEKQQYEKALKYYRIWLRAEPDNADAKAGMAEANSHVSQSSQSSPASEPADAEEGPHEKTEPELAKECADAIARGDLRAACEAEMGRVNCRAKSGNPWKDKVSLELIYSEYVEKIKPDRKQKEEAFQVIEKYLAEHKGEADYVWRINHLLSVIMRDLARHEEAAKYLDAALQSYPKTNYTDPGKYSKYQHLVNERAKMIWESKGVAEAEDFAIEQLKNRKQFDYFFTFWWKTSYSEKKMDERYFPLLRRIIEAYAVRAEKFPESAPLYKQQTEWLEQELSKK